MGSVLEGLAVQYCYVDYVTRGEVMFDECDKLVLTIRVTEDEREALGLGDVGFVVQLPPDQVAFVVEYFNLDGSQAIIGTFLPY